MRNPIRKWLTAGLVALIAAPALGGCVVRPYHGGYYHGGYYGYHDRGWNGHDGYRDGYHDWRH